jgi:hypothetical protein
VALFLPKFDVIRQFLDFGMLGDVRLLLADHGEWFHGNHRIMDLCPGWPSDARFRHLSCQLRHLGVGASGPGEGRGTAALERCERRGGSDPHRGG